MVKKGDKNMPDISMEEIRGRCKSPNKGIWEGGLVRFECPVCGKRFYVTSLSDWVFKRRIKQKATALLYLCSYGCSRKHDQAFGIDK